MHAYTAHDVYPTGLKGGHDALRSRLSFFSFCFVFALYQIVAGHQSFITHTSTEPPQKTLPAVVIKYERRHGLRRNQRILMFRKVNEADVASQVFESRIKQGFRCTEPLSGVESQE